MIGTTIDGRYLIEARLGAGGSANVYRARDNVVGRDVALKVLRTSSEDTVKRFRREFRICAGLAHPNIVKLFEMGQIKAGEYYFTMEYLPYPTLDRLLKDRGALPETEVLDIAGQLAGALAFYHPRGIVHRDLKPANIIMRNDGSVVLMDFGLARSVDMTSMTATGAVLGTPRYLSPEAAMGERVDERSDIFTLGTIIYELLTASNPFPGDSLGLVLHSIMLCKPRPARELRTSINPAWDDFIARCMAREPQDRFQSAQELERAVHSLDLVLHKDDTIDGVRLYSDVAEQDKAPNVPGTAPTGEAASAGGRFSRVLVLVICLSLPGVFVFPRWFKGASQSRFSVGDLKVSTGISSFVVSWKSERAYVSRLRLKGRTTQYVGNNGRPVKDHLVTVGGLREARDYCFTILFPGGAESLPQTAQTRRLKFKLLSASREKTGVLLEWRIPSSQCSAGFVDTGDGVERSVKTSSDGSASFLFADFESALDDAVIISLLPCGGRHRIALRTLAAAECIKFACRFTTLDARGLLEAAKDETDEKFPAVIRDYKLKKTVSDIDGKTLFNLKDNLEADLIRRRLVQGGWISRCRRAGELAPLLFSSRGLPFSESERIYETLMRVVRLELYAYLLSRRALHPTFSPAFFECFGLGGGCLSRASELLILYRKAPVKFGTVRPIKHPGLLSELLLHCNLNNKDGFEWVELRIRCLPYSDFIISLSVNDHKKLYVYDIPYLRPGVIQNIGQRIPLGYLKEGRNRFLLRAERLFDDANYRDTELTGVRLAIKFNQFEKSRGPRGYRPARVGRK